MTTVEIAEVFDARPIARDRYQALCVAHPDRSPSLVITAGLEGRTLLKCWAGCSLDRILAAAGLRKRDLFGESRTLTPAEKETLRREKRAVEARAEVLKSITRRTFDTERLAEIEMRRWAEKLARLPDGHEQESAMAEIFHLQVTAFREAEAASLSFLERRPRPRSIRSYAQGVERVAA